MEQNKIMRKELRNIDKLILALRSSSKENVMNFIRANLAFDSDVYTSIRRIGYGEEVYKEHYRFDMSHNAPINNKILSIFEPLGTQNTQGPFILSFWKGYPSLAFFNEYSFSYDRPPTLRFTKCLSGYGTVEIIYFIFQNTILETGFNRFVDDIDLKKYKGLSYLGFNSIKAIHEHYMSES